MTERKLIPMESGSSEKESGKINEELPNTNRILLQFPSEGLKSYILYIPAYMRLEIRQIQEISLQNLNAKISVQLKFDIDYTDLPEEIMAIVRKNIQLVFQHQCEQFKLDGQSGVQIKERTMKLKNSSGVQEKRHILGYRIKKSVTVRLWASIFWTPFEILYLILSISIEKIEIYEAKEKAEVMKILQRFISQEDKSHRKNINEIDSIDIRFNFMDFNLSDTKYTNEEGQEVDALVRIFYSGQTFFGNYQFAQRLFLTEYSNKGESPLLRKVARDYQKRGICCRIKPKAQQSQIQVEPLLKNIITSMNKKKYDKKIKPYNNSHFQIPLYRIPIVSLLTIFFPIWLLGVASLVIFFQDFALADRVASIATILLAFIAFMPVIREQIPPNPKLTFIEILLYLQIFSTFLCLVDSFIHRNNQSQEIVWFQNGFFMAALILLLLQTFIIILFIILYYCCWRPSYNIKSGQKVLLNLDQWGNKECDNYLHSKIKKNSFILKQYPCKINFEEESNPENANQKYDYDF